MGLFKFGTRCCNNCIHWKCSSKREVRGNPPKEIYATSNCDKCSLTDRNTLSKNCCDGFAHLYGATVTFPYQEEQRSSGGIASALLDSVSEPSRNFTQSVVDYLRESESVQEETQEKPSVRQILIKNGMDSSASKAEQQNFETIYRGMADGDSEAYYLMGQMLYFGQYGAVLDKGIAYRCFLTAAKKGHVKSEYSLGHCYYYGQGVDKDEDRAFAWLKRASEHGDADAKKLLGKIQNDREIRAAREECERMKAARQRQIAECVNDLGMDPNASEMAKTLFMATIRLAKTEVSAQFKLATWFETGECGARKDMALAFAWYLTAAEKGDARAEFKIGVAYKCGDGVPKDDEKSFAWCMKSALQGDSDAQRWVGEAYLGGEGVEKNQEKAIDWLWKSAVQDDLYAIRALKKLGGRNLEAFGMLLDPNADEIKWWKFQQIADGVVCGDVQSIYDLADALYCGKNGAIEDEGASIKWYKMAAERGHVRAQKELGDIYSNENNTIETDNIEALKWYRMAAEQGDANAQYECGSLLMHGDGVVHDLTEAAKWYLKSVENGYTFAYADVADVYLQGKGVPVDIHKAKYWYEKAVKSGDDTARKNLELLLHDHPELVNHFEGAQPGNAE